MQDGSSASTLAKFIEPQSRALRDLEKIVTWVQVSKEGLTLLEDKYKAEVEETDAIEHCIQSLKVGATSSNPEKRRKG